MQIHQIKRHVGVAGQVSYVALVEYDDEPVSAVTFVGSVYGGPVVMTTPSDPKGVFVTNPARFGEFGEEWVRRFFG